MGVTATRELKVSIVGDSRSLEHALGRAGHASSGLGRAFRTLGKAAAIGVGVAFAGMAAALKVGFDELAEGQKVAAQTNAVLKSTGGVANVTAKEVAALAEEQSKLTGIDDELIQASENLLLTFKNVRNEVGEGSDVFNRATKAALDLSTAGFGSVESASKMMGKALNDPIKGMTALGRAGVTFSEDQKKAIKALVDSGHQLEAQKLILKEVESQVGGSAKAYGDTLPGQLSKLRNSLEETAGKLAEMFLPALIAIVGFLNDKLVPALSTAITWVGNFWSKIQAQFSKARSLKAKVNITWEAVEDAARSLVSAIGAAVTDALTSDPLPVSGVWLEPKPEGIDWKALADDMIAGLSAALQESAQLAKALAASVTSAIRRVDWIAAGREMGPGLLALMVTAMATLLDPVFWIKNWDLALAIALTAFSGPLGKLASGVAARFLPAIGGALARISPQLAAAFGRLFDDALRVAGPALERLGAQLGRLAVAVFGRLTKLAVFTIKVLGVQAAINAVKQFASNVISTLKGLAEDAYEWMTTVGFSLVTGLVAGIYSAGASAVKAAVEWLAGLVPSWAKKLLGIGSPSKVMADEVGKPIGEGIAAGIASTGTAVALASAEAARKAIDAAKQAVIDRRGEFATAFSGLADVAMQAFDAKMAEWKPKSQIKLEKMQLQDQIRSEKQAIADAQKELSAAQAAAAQEATAENVQRVKDAQAAVEAAKRSQHEAQLARDAAREQEAHDKQVARDKIRFQDRLDRLGAELKRMTESGGELTAKESAKYRAKLNDLLKDYGIDAKFWGTAIGISLANGLKQAQGQVRTAALALAKAIARLLKTKSPTEEGPMSDLDVWWSGLAPTLVSGIDLTVVTNAGRNIASSLFGGIQSGLQDFSFAALPTSLGNLGGVFAGLNLGTTAPATSALDDVTATMGEATSSVDSFGVAIEALPTRASAAFNKLVDLIKNVLLPLPDLLAPAALAFLAIAEALGSIGSVAYQVRAALRDTAADIERLLRQIAFAGQTYGVAGPAPRQHGGPVKRNQPYIVGEAGPELFIPTTSGRIVANGQATMRAAGGQTVIALNFYGPAVGTDRQFQDLVRRALYDVSKRNPGTGLATT